MKMRDALATTFAKWLGPDDWTPWFAFLAALRGEPMTKAEAAVFRACTGRSTPPTAPHNEAWVVVGRKGRKSAIAALLAVYFAIHGKWKRAEGERLRVMCLALSKDQARIILDYADAILRSRPALQRLIAGRDADSIRLTNGVEIACFANSFRLVRGPTVVCAIMDEVAVWWSDELAANPDKEIVRAIRPSMITQPGALMIGLSSPYAKKGLLFEKHRDHFGRDDSNVLVWQADTATMNRQVDRDLIAQAYVEDPASAAAEFGAQFRDDLQSFIAREAVEACVELGCRERAPERRIEYRAFVDPAGGGKSGNDAMTLAIAHLDGDLVVVDCVREYRPPFTPTDVVAEIAETLKPYRCTIVVGDRFAGEWCRVPFRKFGILYKEADRSKSDIYRDCLPILNSRKVSLLDNPAAVNQICALERRTARGGRDSIDHPRNAHDDLANAVCGVIVMTAQKSFAKPYETGLPIAWGSDAGVQRIDREFPAHPVTENWRRSSGLD